MTKNKKLVSFILTLAMVLSMVPMFGTVAFAVWTESAYLDNAMRGEELDESGVIKSTTTTAAVGGKYTTECSITLYTNVVFGEDNEWSLSVPTGMDVTIDLFGHTIDRCLSSGSAMLDGFVIKVASGASLTIKDTSTSGSGIITGGYNEGNGGGVYVEANGTLIMSGGAIKGNTARNGGGVYVDTKGTLIISGGAISNNTASAIGGGVCVSGGSFTMSGGAISNNTAKDGGGVYVDTNETLILSGGEISNNTASAIGGGVYVSGGSFTMSGGAISNNTAKDGGGVYVDKNGILILSGGAISENKANKEGNTMGNGGGVYVAENGTLKMSGGAISNNTAGDGGGVYNKGSFTMSGNSIISGNNGSQGAGVYFYSGSFVMSGGAITGNVASNMGGGVNVNVSCVFTMFGNSIISNNKGKNGGGVYVGGKFNMTGGEIVNNKATAYGGGVLPALNSIITLGGIAKITGNALDGKPNNVYLLNKKYIQLGTDPDAPKTGMSVGITIEKAPTSATPVAITTSGGVQYVSYFTSDSNAYKVATGSGCLVLKLNPVITFNANGGTCASESAITSAEGKLAVLPIATRNGYTFNGWYTATTGGIKVTTSTVFTSDTTIYAKWTKIPTPPAPVYYGGDVTYYDVVTSAGVNGTIDVDKKSASSGTTVTVTVTPEKGFALETLTVLDKNGKEIEVKDTKEKNKYTFRMPSSKVTVNATFMEDNTMLNYCVDVKKEDYFYDSVLWAYENEICNGTDELHFSPAKTLTRAEAVTMLWRIAGKPVVNYWMQFKDVESGRYYTEAVRWAASEKIAVGYSDEKFGTTDLITREQLAKMIYGYVQKKGQGFTGSWMFLLPYEDRAKISDWANEAAHWCSMKGVINGKDGNLFDPQGTATRAEAVTMLYRFDSLMK